MWQLFDNSSLIDLEDIQSVKGVFSKSSENQAFVCRVKKKDACLDSYNTIHLKAKQKKRLKVSICEFLLPDFIFSVYWF